MSDVHVTLSKSRLKRRFADVSHRLSDGPETEITAKPR